MSDESAKTPTRVAEVEIEAAGARVKVRVTGETADPDWAVARARELWQESRASEGHTYAAPAGFSSQISTQPNRSHRTPAREPVRGGIEA